MSTDTTFTDPALAAAIDSLSAPATPPTGARADGTPVWRTGSFTAHTAPNPRGGERDVIVGGSTRITVAEARHRARILLDAAEYAEGGV